VLRRERGAVDEKIETAEFAIERRAEIGDLLIVGDVARRDERIGELRGELADVFFEPLARVREGEAGACGGGRLRDGPRNRSFVGDADDEAVLALQVRQNP
jgi:hypothetical protein